MMLSRDKNKNRSARILITAGGTGGHLFPAVAIADELKSLTVIDDILFVGTKRRMESEIIPKIGYKYAWTSVVALPRRFGFKMILFVFSLIYSFIQALFIVLKFKPEIGIGTGSYISVPPLLAVRFVGKPIILIEPNLLPGVATKFLAPIAKEIYLAFEESKKYLKTRENIIVTGNPVRKSLLVKDRVSASKYFNLSSELKTILILGGSLGARSINEKIREIYYSLSKDFQIIWQTGKNDYEIYKELPRNDKIVILPFIERMDYAYAMCDLLISRAGASTISEIIIQGLVSVLIPSPNVAENHQYYNAIALYEKGAAELHLDNETSDDLYKKIIELLNNEDLMIKIAQKAKAMLRENANNVIVDRILNILKLNEKQNL